VALHPILSGAQADRPLLFTGSRVVTAAEFLSRARAVAARLPGAPSALNLCERRDAFIIAFVAMLYRQQVCLLPSSRTSAAISEVKAENPGALAYDDHLIGELTCAVEPRPAIAPQVPAQQVVAIGYTSGSTGAPSPHAKRWLSLAGAAAHNIAEVRGLLGDSSDCVPWIVATVPPQHMYGMEMSVLMPLLGHMAIHAGRPLFPADVSKALDEVPPPRILVSTPVHIRALTEYPFTLPDVALIISATAPLSPELARSAEQRFGAPLLELFGATETCVIAARQTAREATWRPYPGVDLRPAEGGTMAAAPWFAGPTLLPDSLLVRKDRRFLIEGRSADVVEVAGKRASLQDLTRRLISIDGVSDAIVFQPDDAKRGGVRRLAALVVAEGLNAGEIACRLGAAVDPVFLPRPLLLVPRLPRNELGKLSRSELQRILADCGPEA
jgi:acyl-coenzyme A synthetase/AMP-(fatty) acid ligase